MTTFEELHPIVALMRPSGEQIPAIVARGRDVAVRAGAGTGKTRTLVARYLALLADGFPLRSVLAITFTQKAAREMRNRVRDQMRLYLETPDVPGEAREFWQGLYRDLDAARISTFHGLCSDILRGQPAEAGIDPRFEVLEEGQAAVLLRRALDETLAWAADDPDAVALFGAVGETALSKTLGVLLSRRLDSEEAFSAVSRNPLEYWQARLPGVRLNAQDEALAALLPVLRRAFEWAGARYASLKREREALDFDDLEQLALRLIEQDCGARARWQAEFDAILVDEFQDTNERQNRLLKLLNEPAGKLFIVGDAKQSIYAFRGADVTVFRRERGQIELGGGLAHSLDTSYRAHRALVAGLNDLLGPVLGHEVDPDRPWFEPFAPLRHDREEACPGFSAPHIELHFTVGTKGKGALERAAEALAGRLYELVECEGIRVSVGRGARALNYGDIAILCRTSHAFGAYEDALETSGIPYLTVAGRGFYGRPEIRDLLNALQALNDPTDDLALARLLRSPAFALPDGALLRLCDGMDAQRRSLWARLPEAAAGRGDQEARRACRAVQIISNLHAQASRIPVADLLKNFLDSTGYRAALVAAGQQRGVRNAAKLLADAQAGGIVGVGEFLEYIANLRDAGTREGEARATAEGSVQIMSIHAAKGLEFQVVVIGDANSSLRTRNGVLVDETLGVLLPQRDEADRRAGVYEVAQQLAKDRDAAESCRLFYVAATRAREKLILSAAITLKQDRTPGRLGDWLSKLAAPAALGFGRQAIEHDEEGGRAVYLPLQTGQTPVAGHIYEPRYVSAARRQAAAPATELDEALPPPLLEPVIASIECLDEPAAGQERIPAQRVWRVIPPVGYPTAPAWVVGSLVHAALAAWRFPPQRGAVAESGGETPSPADPWERWVEAQARSYGLIDRRQLRDAVASTGRLLSRFRTSALYLKMASAERRLHEVPYSLAGPDGRTESGIIDALILVMGRWQVVEFKTDHIRDAEDLERLLRREDYVPQMQRYGRAVASLLATEPELLLCLLNYAGGVRVHVLPG